MSRGYPLNNTNFNWERRLARAAMEGGKGGSDISEPEQAMLEYMEINNIPIIDLTSYTPPEVGDEPVDITAAVPECFLNGYSPMAFIYSNEGGIGFYIRDAENVDLYKNDSFSIAFQYDQSTDTLSVLWSQASPK